jgi:hypothetical protein
MSVPFVVVEGTPTAAACVGTNLIKNPSFENPKLAPWINYHGAIGTSSNAIKASDFDSY